MKCLLDTHTFLWALSETDKLSRKAIEVIKNPRNEIYVSSITFWEISIKTRIKKLDLDDIKPEDLIPLAEKMELELISLSPEEAITYHNLVESTHNDPFDRMLIWQSISRDLVLISKDSEFKKFLPYGLKLLW
jgi:PIN domain nuclease of toxin-antitoxin system